MWQKVANNMHVLRTTVTFNLIFGLLAMLVTSSAIQADQPTSQPTRTKSYKSSRSWDEIIKYRSATQEQIAAYRARAMEMAEKAHAFAPNMHLVESPHFLIFTEWGRSNDSALRDICEKMYPAMCKQFDIPISQNIWGGKFPIYIFWERDHYVEFTNNVDKVGKVRAGGYHLRRGWFSYIVMNRCDTKIRFYGLLVHEATHAFIGRYLTNRRIPRWTNEGLAEYMSALFVPRSKANKQYKRATRTAVRNNRDVSSIFKEVRLNSFDYGIAHSLVRFMIARDRKAFVRFIKLLKEGSSEADALKESYNLTGEQLLRSWGSAAGKIYGRR